MSSSLNTTGEPCQCDQLAAVAARVFIGPWSWDPLVNKLKLRLRSEAVNNGTYICHLLQPVHALLLITIHVICDVTYL
jgi:hypothetical protein